MLPPRVRERQVAKSSTRPFLPSLTPHVPVRVRVGHALARTDDAKRSSCVSSEDGRTTVNPISREIAPRLVCLPPSLRKERESVHRETAAFLVRPRKPPKPTAKN